MVAMRSPAFKFTEAEYLALEQAAQVKHEFVRGQILAMEGAEVAHNLVVRCGPLELAEQRPQSLLNPEIIVEVLSPSTEHYDRGEKWSAYGLYRLVDL